MIYCITCDCGTDYKIYKGKVKCVYDFGTYVTMPKETNIGTIKCSCGKSHIFCWDI